MYGLAVHGGAGTILRENLTPQLEGEFRQALADALRAGKSVLVAGGSSVEAVEAVVVFFEDCPLFNAGHGACFTSEGTHELDAAIMDGAGRAAGAVAVLRHVKNPIKLARLIMEKTPHVLLVGDGAEEVAACRGLELVAPEYFSTPRRWEQLQRAKAAAQGKTALSEDLQPKAGTVGAVALDAAGNLAAATSTGGMTNKRCGRVGDSPLIGAGTYADNATCAVSCTGHGEYFMRAVAAYDVAALMAYRGLSVQNAARTVVMEKLLAMEGRGGLVAIDRQGRIAMPFNTPGMYRGGLDADGDPVVAIFDEPLARVD